MALKFTAPFRPAEEKDYTCDWTAEMNDTSDTIFSAVAELSQAATDIGLEVYQTQVSSDGKKVAIWVRSSNHDLTRSAVLGQSINVLITHTIVTTFGRHLTQTLQLKVSES